MSIHLLHKICMIIIRGFNGYLFLILLAGAIFIAKPCFSIEDLNDSTKSLETVTLQLKWKHQFQFAGYYAALEKGFYQKAGLNVKILEAKDGEESTDQVIKGEADFGIAMSNLILLRAKGHPVVVLASIYQHSPLIILAPKANGIENVHALKGKRIALESHSAELLAYLEFEGIPIAEMKIFPHEYSVSNLIAGQVDAISAYSTDEPFMFLNQGIEYRIFSPRAGGIDFYGDTLFTNEKKLRESPESVSAFLKASLEGWRYALDNTDEIIDLILSRYTRRHSREHLLFEAQMSKKLIMADVIELGYMNAGRWRHIAQTYEKLGMIDSDFSFEGFVYTPNPEADYTWVKWFVGVTVGTSLLVGIGALFLMFFNKKLKVEINERKLSEKATIKERDYISKVLYWIDSLVVVIDSQGYVISFNRASEQLSGYRLEDLKGKPFWETLLAPDEKEGVKRTIKDVIQKELPKDIQNHWVTKTGEKRLIQWHNSALRKRDGSVQYILCAGLDITERQKAETALLESESKYRELVQYANSIILRIDTQGNLTFFNEYAQKFFGYKAEEIIGENAFDTIAPRTDSSGRNLDDLVSNIKAHPERYASTENENRLRNGERVWVAWTNKAIYDLKGNIKEILCIGNDITERKSLEKQLHQSQKMEALGTLAGGIAHEFNNILGIIIGNTELAVDDVPEWNPAKNCLDEIRLASLRAKDVVRQIMSFARKTSVQRTPIQISTIIQESLKLMRATIPTPIEIHRQIRCKSELILANVTEINQILMNLCTNSVHAMGDQAGILEIGLEAIILDSNSVRQYEDLKPGKFVKLTVKDTGHGIRTDILDKIFDPYFTTKDVDVGLGMGLAIVYGIVKKHAGAIKINSAADKGTYVEVLFPVIKDTGELEAVEIPEGLPTGTESILFADDEVSLVKMVKLMLGRLGYQVTGKDSSIEALKVFQKNPEHFDLIITDMAMPQMEGDRLVQELFKVRSDIPIIICTGHSDRIDEEEARRLGIAAFHMKPYDKKMLANTVRKVLDEAKKKT